ncbi:MAG: thiamine-phosphate kinase [Pirellulales bacterium]
MELAFVTHLRQRLPTSHPLLRIGPGDDAAVLAAMGERGIVVTTDLLTDGVHFDLASTEPRRVGHKALGVNLSDLAAMAAEPVAVVISLALPLSRERLELAKELYEGMLALAERFDVAIAGGDTNTWDGPLVISVTALGRTTPRGPLLRSGARPGDRLLVTGELGGSILGRHLDCEPRVREALLLHERYDLHAGMDVSDGLALDLSRMCEASGVGAIVDVDRVPISGAANELSRRDPQTTALEHALSDGEDFELLLAVPPDAASRIVHDQAVECGIRDVGEFTAEPGLRQRTADQISPLAPRGYVHR